MMIREVVLDITKALDSNVDNDKTLDIEDLIQETSFVWRKDYTIAISKDGKKTKIADFMVCNTLNETEQTFKVKREKDYWRKLEPREDYEAVVECSIFSKDTTLYTIETSGRDIMRSRKEVPTVASKGFVWVVHVDLQVNLDSLFQLYFKEDYISLNQGETKHYIGWTDNLKSLDMRNFICDPILKTIKI